MFFLLLLWVEFIFFFLLWLAIIQRLVTVFMPCWMFLWNAGYWGRKKKCNVSLETTSNNLHFLGTDCVPVFVITTNFKVSKLVELPYWHHLDALISGDFRLLQLCFAAKATGHLLHLINLQFYIKIRARRYTLCLKKKIKCTKTHSISGEKRKSKQTLVLWRIIIFFVSLYIWDRKSVV